MPWIWSGEPPPVLPVSPADESTICCENSDVLPAEVVDVADTRKPGATVTGERSTLNAAWPEPSVVTGVVPIHFSPSK